MGDRKGQSRHGIFLYHGGEVYAGQWLSSTRASAVGNSAESTDGHYVPCSLEELSHGYENSDYESDTLEQENQRRSSSSNEFLGVFCPSQPRRAGWGVHLRGPEKYEGEWVENSRHGLGCLTLRSGDRYIGQFAHGAQRGKGVSVSPNGMLYKEVREGSHVIDKQLLFSTALPQDGCDSDNENGLLSPSPSKLNTPVAGKSGKSSSSRGKRAGSSESPPSSASETSSESEAASPRYEHQPYDEWAENGPRKCSRRNSKRKGLESFEERLSRSNVKAIETWSVNEVAHLLSTVGYDPATVELLKVHRVDGYAFSMLSQRSCGTFLKEVFGKDVFSPPKNLLVVLVHLLLKLRHRLSVPQITVDSLKQRFKHVELQEGELSFEKVIGEGGYGRVYQAKFNSANVAAKVFRSKDRDHISKDFYSELCALGRLRHPNITLLLGVSFRPRYIIVTEFVKCGSLFDLLHRHQNPPEWSLSKVVSTAREICLGMTYLHFQGIVHCDMKSSNILISDTWEVKICDFGLAHLIGDGTLHDKANLGCVGTHHWMAPEVLRGEEYSQAADVYSFGMILWEMVSRQVPFHGLTAVQVIGIVGYGRRKPRPPRCPEPLLQVLHKALRPMPHKRSSFRELSEDFENLHRLAVIDVEESLRNFFSMQQ